MSNNENDDFFRASLNEEQWEAVRYNDGPSLVIASAGSGKTRVLTYKIAYLLKCGIMPWQILALTFTNKAAREMCNRISEIVGAEATRQVWCGTFHAIFARILRIESEAIDYRSDFTIYDTADAKSLLKSIIKEMGLDEKIYKPAIVAGRISEAKSLLFTPSHYANDNLLLHRDRRDNIGEVHRIYSTYQQRLFLANAMDFDDLLLNTYLLFDQHPEIRQKYSERFKNILVDEYQDTNLAQYRIISQLTFNTSHICVVGDDAQSIYGFRGANIDNILKFTELYPSAQTFKLERNYRSTQTIVDAANSIIKHNKRQIPKEAYSHNEVGDKIRLLVNYSDKEESSKICGEIRALHRNANVDYNHIALLYRTNAQSRVFEETFRTADIPYRIYGGLSFYQRKEIKDVLAYFRLINNHQDEEAFKRIINYPTRGIGKTTTDKLQMAATEHNTSQWEVCSHPSNFGVELNKGALNKLGAFQQLIVGFREKQNELSAYALAAEIVRSSGIGADITSDKSPENLSRQENVQELLNSIKTFETEQREEQGNLHVTLSDYLAQVSLLTDIENEEEDTNSVTLMTVHAAKGLEFDTVFITGMEDDLFPNANARYSPREMEEERRLFYVAVTRAKKRCFLSYAKSRMKYGMIEPANPSPFIKDIDSKYIATNTPTIQTTRPSTHSFDSRPAKPQTFPFAPSSTSTSRPRNLWAKEDSPAPRLRKITPTTTDNSVNKYFSSYSKAGLEVGNMIEHERFGIGKVVSINEPGDNAKAVVDFQHVGRKTLLLKFVRYKLLK